MEWKGSVTMLLFGAHFHVHHSCMYPVELECKYESIIFSSVFLSPKEKNGKNIIFDSDVGMMLTKSVT